MIGIAGNWVVQFSIAGQTDFLDPRDLQKLSIIEEAGNALPMFETTFFLTPGGDDILRYLNEGNPIEIAMGGSEVDITNVSFRMLNKQIVKMSPERYVVHLTGLMDSINYYLDAKINVTPKQSGVETILNAAENHFEIDTNVTRSSDRQNWIQYNISDKNFVNQTWMHSYLPNSFPAIGITSTGIFVFRDIKKLARSGYKWKFVPKDTHAEDEITYGKVAVESKTGLMNAWQGYEKTKEIWDIDNSAASTDQPSLQTILATSNKLDRNPNIGNRASEFGLLTDNVHSNYWKAYQQNLGYLAVFGTTDLLLEFNNVYKDVRVLDLVKFTDISISSVNAAEEYYSGSYLVSKVTRLIQANQFYTLVNLSRESLGGLQGDFE